MTKKGLSLTLLFIISSYLYMAFSHKFAPSSDSMSGILEAVDIADGNITLKGWYLSTVSFYFTDLVWFAIAIKIFGYVSWITYVIPGMMAGALITACYALSINTGSKNTWPLFLFMAIPGTMVSYMLSVAIIHVPTYLYIVLLYILIESYCKTQSISYIYFTIILSSLTIFSDDITMYLFFIPVALSCILSKGNSKNRILIFLSLIVSYILYKVMLTITNSPEFFFLPGMPSPAFVSYEKLGFNLSLLFKGLLILFNADFLGKQISSLDGIYSSIKFVSALFFFFLIYKAASRSKNFSLIDISLLVSSLIMIPAYTMSDKPVDEGTTRYLVPVIIFGSIFICRNLRINTKLNSALLLFTVIISSCSLIFINKPDLGLDFNRSGSKYHIISDFLTANNLNSGYATFWYSASISSTKIFNIGPVNIDTKMKTIEPVFWLSKTSNFNNGNKFFIVENEEQQSVVEGIYGKPESIHKLVDVIIIIYNDPINLNTGDIFANTENVLSEFKVGDNGKICNNGKGGSIAFGPYKDIGRGKYYLKVTSSGDDFIVGVSSHLTGKRVVPSKISSTNGLFYFDLKDDFPSGEIVITAHEGSNTCFKSYEFERVSN